MEDEEEREGVERGGGGGEVGRDGLNPLRVDEALGRKLTRILEEEEVRG